MAQPKVLRAEECAPSLQGCPYVQIWIDLWGMGRRLRALAALLSSREWEEAARAVVGGMGCSGSCRLCEWGEKVESGLQVLRGEVLVRKPIL